MRTFRWRGYTIARSPFIVSRFCVVRALAVLSIACDPSQQMTENGVPDRTRNALAGAGDSVSFEIEAPRQARSGRTIPIVLRLRNSTAGTLTLHLLGRAMTYDIIARDSSGREVFRLLHDRATPAILRLERFPAGEAREMAYRWEQRGNDGEQVPPGDYTLEAELPTDAAPIRSAAIPLRILPR